MGILAVIDKNSKRCYFMCTLIGGGEDEERNYPKKSVGIYGKTHRRPLVRRSQPESQHRTFFSVSVFVANPVGHPQQQGAYPALTWPTTGQRLARAQTVAFPTDPLWRLVSKVTTFAPGRQKICLKINPTPTKCRGGILYCYNEQLLTDFVL